jgi:hypothetical protein
MKRKPGKAPGTPTPQMPERRGAPDVDSDRVVARPDGYYWVADGGEQEFGPFPTAAQALAAAEEAADSALRQAQALRDVEAELDVPDRLDRDVVEPDEQTGQAAQD